MQRYPVIGVVRPPFAYLLRITTRLLVPLTVHDAARFLMSAGSVGSTYPRHSAYAKAAVKAGRPHRGPLNGEYCSRA